MTDNPANNPAEVAGPACPHCGTAIGGHEANACLNVWVGTSLFGWVDTWVAHERSGGVPKVYANLPERQRDYVAIECPPYSTSISAAWEVVKHILKQPMNRGVDDREARVHVGRKRRMACERQVHHARQRRQPRGAESWRMD